MPAVHGYINRDATSQGSSCSLQITTMEPIGLRVLTYRFQQCSFRQMLFQEICLLFMDLIQFSKLTE